MASGTPISRSVVIASVPLAASELCRQMLAEVEAQDFSQEDVFAVHLALEEAFLNAIKHGNKMEPDKHIKVDYSIDVNKVEISLADEGSGFDPNVVADPRCSEHLYKTNGRGLLLMRSYMDVVEYNERGNLVHMIRYREKPRFPDTVQELHKDL
jgi:serine/threonine-protein kinase RsbW